MRSIRHRAWSLVIAVMVLISGIALVAHASPGDPECWEGAGFECGPSGRGGQSASGTATSSTWSSDTSRATTTSTSSSSGSSTSSTAPPNEQLPNINISFPGSGDTVGIAQPVFVTFDKVLDQAGKSAVERSVQVQADAGVRAGRVHWREEEGKSVAHWRPDAYWPKNTSVKVTIGKAERQFKVGGETTVFVNDGTHTMTVFKDGKEVKRIPVSLGKKNFETPRGNYYVAGKANPQHMKSPDGTPKTDPEYYDLDVNWAVRFSSHGHFIHAASWSVGSQGKENVSHGCVNASDANAKWLYENVRSGDPIIVEGAKGEPYKLDRDMYGDWNEAPLPAR